MLMDEYRRWKEKLLFDVNLVLMRDVADMMLVNIFESVQRRVYDMYAPKVYERRKTDGGLQDGDNYDVWVNDQTLYITNMTMDNGYTREENRFINDVVESGEGYDGYSPGPRPFMQEAVDDGLADGSLEFALEAGLERLGYEGGV